jgi:hypothetical protein
MVSCGYTYQYVVPGIVWFYASSPDLSKRLQKALGG